MECNKDEAVRAMQLSEEKIQNKDFKGAKEMALKAQRLYPQLDNISRLITVCEIHCAAEKKVGRSEMDWYGILQVQQFDDRETIKKQYKKFTLLLHPDKTSLTGAEAAFKLIGEAYRVLFDQGSRSKYDIRYSTLVGTGTRSFGHQSSINFVGPKYSSAKSSVPQSRYTSVNLQQPLNVQQPVQQDAIKIACTSCKRMYDYNFSNRLIFCQRCLGIFDASDLGAESLGNQFANHTVAPSQAAQSNGRSGTLSSTTIHNGNATSKAASAAEVGRASKTVRRDIENAVGLEKQGVKRSESSPLKSKDSRKSRKMRRKRGDNSTLGSGDSSKTGKGAQAVSEVIVLEKVGNPSEVSENHTRRSVRNMQNPCLFETLDDDDDDAGDVNVNDDGNVGPSEVRENSLPNANKRKRNYGSVDGGVYRPTVLALFAMDEYNKLGKQRVRRKKSCTSEIELQLEETSMADGNGSKSMADGNGSKSMADRNGSKSMADGNGSKSMADGNGSKSLADSNGSKFMADNNGSKFMADNNGSKSLADSNGSKSMANNNGRKFMADSNGWKVMADNNGRKSMADSIGSKSLVDNNGGKSMADSNGSKSMADNNGSKSMTSMRKINEVPEPEFHAFALSKAELQRTFKANQTWVLYDPADGMPRRYACIRKVLSRGFKVKMTWLEPDPDDKGEVDWCSKKLPVACGKFGCALTEEVTDHTVFSHEYIHSTKGKDKSSFRIHPRKGETWALYQDWYLGWSSEPERHSQYKFDFVELLSDFSERVGAGVSYLGKVKGFVSLFEPAVQYGVVRFQVPPNELYRFSHQIPSHKMTGREGYGVPPDSFEFDPASLPASLFDRRSVVTIAKPSGFIPSGRPRPAAKQVKKDPEWVEDKNGNLNVKPIVID